MTGRYDELSPACQQAISELVNTIAAIGCAKRATGWVNTLRSQIMDRYNPFVPTNYGVEPGALPPLPALTQVLAYIEANGGRLFPDWVEEGLSNG